jgi:2-polyprenyl-3-methyl-5-hydroxy-6-metoxy-1,4-benzoquinol methylase
MDFEISKCTSCSLVQIFPVPSPDELKNLYETYYNFGGESNTVYTRLRERFYSSRIYGLWLAVDGDISFHRKTGSGRLLDIGCNEGRGLRIYQRNGFEAEGLELNKRAATEASKAGFQVYTDLLEDFQPEKTYDVAVLSNVLEHSIQPKEMLSHVARVLKPEGQVWISCPNVESWQRRLFGRYWINWHVPFHIVHFSRATLANILQETGFEIQEERQQSPALWVAHSLIARLFAKQGRPTNQLRNPILIASLMMTLRMLLFPFLWLGNHLGQGDCLRVIARKK